MQRCCIYKLKEGKSVNKFEEKFSRYVYVEDFAKHPLDKDMELQTIYRYVDIDTLELTSQICNCYILPVSTFEEYFDLYMDIGEIKERLIDKEEQNYIDKI